MGKSLSVLALAMKTLDAGQLRADELNKDLESKSRIKYSRSTLIVVSSSCRSTVLPRRSLPYIWLICHSVDHQLDERDRQVCLASKLRVIN